jgi:hypothetical protein
MKSIQTAITMALLVSSSFAVVLIAAPRFTNSVLRGTSFIASGLGGVTNGPYTLLASISLAMPLTNWTAAVTNSFDGNGRFNLTNSINPAVRQQFYALQALPAANGLWIPTCGAWLGAEVTNNTAANDSNHEAMIGRQLDILRFYHGNGNYTLLTDEKNYIKAGRRILSSFKLDGKWANCTGGVASVNSSIASLAKSIAVYAPTQMMVCIWHEPENDVGKAGTTNEYVAMWQNTRSIFDANGATNVIWVWAIENYSPLRHYLSGLWPGNAYVDWIGWDVYQGSASDNFIADQTGACNYMTTNSTPTVNYTSKPWAWTEWGVGINGWFPTAAQQSNTFNAVNTALNSSQFPRIRYAAYFDVSGSSAPNATSAILDGAWGAYSNFANSPYMKQECSH